MATKALGIEIAGRKVVLVALSKSGETIENCTGGYKPIVLEDDNIHSNVILFRNTLYATIDGYDPEVVLIRARNPKGKGIHAPSPISFKVEGIIQSYEKCAVHLVAPQTVAAFFKKNTATITPSYGYQADALNLVYHYLRTSK